MDERSSFSARHGYAAPEAEITVREDAPELVRAAVLALGNASGMSVDTLRSTVCEVLLRVPDRNNWSPSNVSEETQHLVFEAPWFRVYDIAERIYDRLYNQGRRAEVEFAYQLNEVFREHGIGYEMKDGRVIGRGSLAFREATEEAIRLMDAAAKLTAAIEMRHALSDISRRPPDITGAVQHGMAAFECTARDVMGQSSASLGQLLPGLGLMKPLDKGVEGLWGYASQYGRHVAEGKDA